MNPIASRNIELKCRCGDLAAALALVQTLSPTDAGVLHQIDTYFHARNGRLKLREIVGVKSELIWYDRSNEATTRRSEYRLTPVTHPAELKASLDAALGTRGQVIKHRHVLLWKNVRIHLDQVRGLGSFVEFEAVITGNETEETGHERLNHLCEILKIGREDFSRRFIFGSDGAGVIALASARCMTRDRIPFTTEPAHWHTAAPVHEKL